MTMYDCNFCLIRDSLIGFLLKASAPLSFLKNFNFYTLMIYLILLNKHINKEKGVSIVMFNIYHRLSTAAIFFTISCSTASFLNSFRCLYSSVKLESTIFSATPLSKVTCVLYRRILTFWMIPFVLGYTGDRLLLDMRINRVPCDDMTWRAVGSPFHACSSVFDLWKTCFLQPVVILLSLQFFPCTTRKPLPSLTNCWAFWELTDWR